MPRADRAERRVRIGGVHRPRRRQFVHLLIDAVGGQRGRHCQHGHDHRPGFATADNQLSGHQKRDAQADPFPELIERRPRAAEVHSMDAGRRVPSDHEQHAGVEPAEPHTTGRCAQQAEQPEQGQAQPEHHHRQAVAADGRAFAGEQRPADHQRGHRGQ